jgi:hypothetical protein
MKPDDLVFLSASVPNRPPFTEDSRPAEIEEAIVSIARAVFSRKGRLLFGGHPSVSPLIVAIAGEYYAPDPQREVRPVVTFQSEHFRGRLPDETWQLFRMGWSSIQWTPQEPGETEKERLDNSLKRMREWMLLGPDTPPEIVRDHRLQPPRAMLAVGGMEGIFQEAGIFVSHRAKWGVAAEPPVIAIKSGGGAAAQLTGVPSLEESWRKANPKVRLPESLPFQPYAAMTQWLMDEVLK